MTASKQADIFSQLKEQGIKAKAIRWQLSPEELTAATLVANEGLISDSGALCINTGKYTGRSPKDRYIVRDSLTESTVDWNNVNQPISEAAYFELKTLVEQHLAQQEVLYVHDAQAGADIDYRISVRLVAEKPWSAQFASNMFLRLSADDRASFAPDWHILCAPTCHATADHPELHDTNFVLVNFTDRTVVIAGTGYTGEIKKSIFSVLNYMLPTQHGVLPMHCSANVGDAGDTAIFFGLSGTGKTTLSTDANRKLIGDDEHGWSSSGVFNFEGGCYAKCINLNAEKEPEIYGAIKKGAILENIGFMEGSNIPNFEDDRITQNTRVSYPIHHIDNIKQDSKGGQPQHIFFLTCDAFGVLPPVSKLTTEQAMYHFISGYTAKVAGTEAGVSEPTATFSACFGAPFLPLHPGQYADMLGEKIDAHGSHIWLINTGWISGSHPEGHRISLKHTRAIIQSILKNELLSADYAELPVFGLRYPTRVAGVPSDILNPIAAWTHTAAYEAKAEQLARLFNDNFKNYAKGVSSAINEAAPTPELSMV